MGLTSVGGCNERRNDMAQCGKTATDLVQIFPGRRKFFACMITWDGREVYLVFELISE